jgi:hypothetical protein
MLCSLADKYITNFSVEPVASILRVPSWRCWQHVPTLKTETAGSSETLVPTYQTTQQAGVDMDNEVGGACGTYSGEEKYTGLWARNLREGDYLKTQA